MKNLIKAAFLVLDEVILVTVTLIILWMLGVQMHPLIIMTVLLLTGFAIFIVFRAIRSTSRISSTGGKKSMLGLTGYVITPLDPEGLVRTRGELWKAECTGDTIDCQEEIIVIGVQGLKLLVKRKDDSEKT